MLLLVTGTKMPTTYPNAWNDFCTINNLYEAYEKARKGKANSVTVKVFERHERRNLVTLFHELYTGTYNPRPLKRFVLRDPKTRVISVSDFRDRIVHHMIVNIIQPIFEPQFIYDSYANRISKGTRAAVRRAQTFIRKTTRNNKTKRSDGTIRGYCLKCDVKSYFDTVDHETLMTILRRKVSDERFLALIRRILDNHETVIARKGMPLGNWTSQFFANIYLNELDQHVKHVLKIKHYIRYVDDFVLFHRNARVLDNYRASIDAFLTTHLALRLHPTKCRVIPLHRSVLFLGFRLFPYHILVQKRNLRKLRTRTARLIAEYRNGLVRKEDVLGSFDGWCAYAGEADAYKLKEQLRERMERELVR